MVRIRLNYYIWTEQLSMWIWLLSFTASSLEAKTGGKAIRGGCANNQRVGPRTRRQSTEEQWSKMSWGLQSRKNWRKKWDVNGKRGNERKKSWDRGRREWKNRGTDWGITRRWVCRWVHTGQIKCVNSGNYMFHMFYIVIAVFGGG